MSGLPRGSLCQFGFFNNLSCWVAGFSVRCSQCTRADRSCTDICPLMDSSVPINFQPSRIALDHCLSFLDQDVLRIRHAVDSFARRCQELSHILAGVQFPCASEESLNLGYMGSEEHSFSAFIASDDSTAYSAISELFPSVTDSSLVVPDVPSRSPSVITDLSSVDSDSESVVSSGRSFRFGIG